MHGRKIDVEAFEYDALPAVDRSVLVLELGLGLGLGLVGPSVDSLFVGLKVAFETLAFSE